MQESPLYRELEFPTNFSVIDTLDDLKALVDTLYESDKLLGFDIETGYSGKDTPKESTNVYSDRQFIVGFSITNDFSWARYVPLKHDFGQNIDPEKAWELMKPLLEEKKGVIHNYHFEASNLREIEAKGDGPSIVLPISNWYDSMLEAYVLADVPANRISGSIAGGELVRRYLPPFHRTEDMFAAEHASSFAVNLKSLTKFRYNYDQKNIFTLFNGGKDLTAKQKESIRFNTLPIDENVAHYACDDAVFCLQLHNDQFARIMEDDYLPFVYNLEREIADILVDMSKSGVGVDWEGINNHLGMYEHFLDRMLSDTRKKFEKETGSSQASLNFKSAPQMRKVIYGPKEEGGLGLTTSVETDSGEKSTSEKALTTLRKESPAINSLLNYRQCIKMGNWFEQIKSFEGRYDDNRLHPGFLQTVVPSGRFSSSGPNVQQIAKRWWFQIPDGSVAEVMEEGTLGEDYWTGNARDFIVPEEGYSLLSFDYASAEIQMVGALAQEKEIMDAFHRGEDFHKWAASLMYSKPISEVTKKERQSAKTFAFGSLYGQSVAALAQQLGVTKDEGEKMQSMYFTPFPRLAGYFDQQHAMAEKDLEVRTMIGRKITLWNGMHDNGKIRSGAKRVSVNAPVQGSATGDYVKIAMVNVRNVLRQKGWWGTKVKLIMNQHDSLVFEVSNELDMKEVVDTLTPAVQYNLAGVQGFYNEFEDFPPMNVDWEAGHSWGSIVSIDDYHLLGVERITLSFDSTPTVEDVKTLNAVMHTNPGNTIVDMRINGEYVGTLNHSVASSPDVFKKFKYGDPDIGIKHAIGDKVSIDIP